MLDRERLNPEIRIGRVVVAQKAEYPDQLSLYTINKIKGGMVTLRRLHFLTDLDSRASISIGITNLEVHGANAKGTLRFEVLPEEEPAPVAETLFTQVMNGISGDLDQIEPVIAREFTPFQRMLLLKGE